MIDNSDIAVDDVVHEIGYLPMRDGVRLAFVLWRPKWEGRYPTVLAYGTYAESGTQFADARRFLAAGYAYVGVNVRGTGASEGAYSYYQPIEGADGVEVIGWVASRSWSTGDVGMIGGSYLGHTQIKVAALAPPQLRAIVPVATEGNEYRDEGMTGGLFNAGLMGIWTFGIQPDLARMGVEARLAAGDVRCASCAEVQLRNPAYHEVQQHPVYDEWWRARALEDMARNVTVPALIIHAWQDEWIRPNGALRLFTMLRSPQKKLILQNGPHQLGGYQMIQREQMRWLDRWVKGVANGIESEQPVTVHWEVTEQEDRSIAVPNWTTTHATWPVPEQLWATYFLTAGGGLSLDPVREAEGLRKYVYPLGTELVGSSEQFGIEPHPLGALSYRTDPMTSDVVILGIPQLTLFFSTERADTDFMFTLKDVDAAGNVLFLQRSVLRASMRAIDQELSTPDEVIQSFSCAEPLVPGAITELRVSLSAVGHVVRKDHRLELSILAPNPAPSPVWGFLPISGPGMNTVYHDERHRSQLRLPVVPGARALKPAPRSGALRNQPWRSARRVSGTK